jgi:hypothetical protein
VTKKKNTLRHADLCLSLAPTYKAGEAETAVALMESLYSAKGFEAFYEAHADDFNGRSGLYAYVLALAVCLEWTASINGGWDDWDWYLTCDQLAMLIVQSDPPPNEKRDMDALCRQALTP